MAFINRQNKLFNPLPLCLLTFVFILTLLYQIFFQSSVFASVLESIVYNNSKSELKITVLRSSILYGFEFSDIRLIEKKNRKPLFEAKRINLAWFLPSVFAGHIGIREFRLDSARIFLHNNNGRWNWYSFIKPSKNKKETKKVPQAIALFFELRTYLKIIIEDLAIVYSETKTFTNKKETTSLQIENIDFQLGLISNPFSSIPLDFNSIYLFDSVILALNPSRPIKLKFKGKQMIQGDLAAKLFLLFENNHKNKKPEFALRLELNSEKLAMYSSGGRLLGHSGLKLEIDSSFDAYNDKLLIHRFKLNHLEETWLSLQARINQVSIPERNLLVKVNASRISLHRIDRLVSILGNGNLANSMIGGTVILKPFFIEGPLDRLEIKGALSADQVFIRTGGGHYLDRLNIEIASGIDIYGLFPEGLRPPDYDINKPLAFGLFRHANIPNLQLVYNKASLNAQGVILPSSGMSSKLRIRNFILEKYFPSAIRGTGSLVLELTAPLDFSKLNFNGNLNLINARYYLKRSRSGTQNLKLQAKGVLRFKHDFILDLNDVLLRAYSMKGEQMLYLKGKSNMNFTGIQDYNLNISNLLFNVPVLFPLLPGIIQDALKPSYQYLSKGISLNTKTRLKFSDQYFFINGKTQVELPYLKLKNILIEHSIDQKKKRLNVKKLKLHALNGALLGSLSGHLLENESLKPNLHLRLELSRSSFVQVHQDLKLLGTILINAKINPKNVSGNVLVKNLDIDFNAGNCAKINQQVCEFYYLRQMNLHLPFYHEYKPLKKINLSHNPAREYLQQNLNIMKSNFSIQSLFSSHNPQGDFTNKKFYYLGSPVSNKKNGMSASVFYKKNILVMNKLRLNLYQYKFENNEDFWKNSGTIHGKDMYLNLSDIQAENMEAGLRLQIKDLDLEPFLPKSQSTYNGIISADLNAVVKNFKSPLYSTNAYASIFKISREFSGFVTRVIMPARVVALVVRNTLEIPRINMELKDGLVYSSIKVNRARLFPGLFVAPGSDEIKQERMPLARFLDKARDEVQTIGNEASSVTN